MSRRISKDLAASQSSGTMNSGTSKGYSDLQFVERILALVATVPMFPPRGGIDLRDSSDPQALEARRATAQAELGPAFKELSKLLRDESWRFSGICSAYLQHRDESQRLQDAFTLSIQSWGATGDHMLRRWGFLKILFELHAGIIESMRTLPAPPASVPIGDWGRPNSQKSGDGSMVWNDVTDRQRQILAAIGGGRLTSKEIATKLALSEGLVKASIAPLRKAGILKNTRGGGYWIDLIPEGIPNELRRRWTPS